MKRNQAPIVGGDIADQRGLRIPQGVRDLDEFLAFLARLEALFGRIERRREITTGDHFLL